MKSLVGRSRGFWKGISESLPKGKALEREIEKKTQDVYTVHMIHEAHNENTRHPDSLKFEAEPLQGKVNPLDGSLESEDFHARR